MWDKLNRLIPPHWLESDRDVKVNWHICLGKMCRCETALCCWFFQSEWAFSGGRNKPLPFVMQAMQLFQNTNIILSQSRRGRLRVWVAPLVSAEVGYTVKTSGSRSHREGAQGGQEEFGCYRSSSAPHAANQLPGVSSAAAGVVLEPERSRILCVKPARRTRQRCHDGQSSVRKVRRINSFSKRIPCVLRNRMAAMNYYSI